MDRDKMREIKIDGKSYWLRYEHLFGWVAWAVFVTPVEAWYTCLGLVSRPQIAGSLWMATETNGTAKSAMLATGIATRAEAIERLVDKTQRSGGIKGIMVEAEEVMREGRAVLGG